MKKCRKKYRKFKSANELINIFNTIHNNKYLYEFDIFNKVIDKINIICPEHGEFYQSIVKHLMGQGCNKCKYLNIASKRRTPQSDQ